MKRLLYILGVALLFALVGAWAANLAGSGPLLWSLGGAGLGAWIGSAFAGRAPARRR